ILQTEPAERIAAARIETGGYQQQRRTVIAHRPAEIHRKCAQDLIAPRTRGERAVQLCAFCISCSRLISVARSRIPGGLMRTEEEHTRISVKDILRAVAVVHVPIGNSNPINAVLLLRITR